MEAARVVRRLQNLAGEGHHARLVAGLDQNHDLAAVIAELRTVVGRAGAPAVHVDVRVASLDRRWFEVAAVVEVLRAATITAETAEPLAPRGPGAAYLALTGASAVGQAPPAQGGFVVAVVEDGVPPPHPPHPQGAVVVFDVAADSGARAALAAAEGCASHWQFGSTVLAVFG